MLLIIIDEKLLLQIFVLFLNNIMFQLKKTQVGLIYDFLSKAMLQEVYQVCYIGIYSCV